MPIYGAALMGGGSGPAFAAISVTYPAGASCTCALGSKTFTAPDSSGQALFIVPTAGEWVVTIIQSGQEAKSQTVSVTEPIAYVIELSFQLYLYEDGDENMPVTGGWERIAKGINSSYPNGTDYYTLTKEAESMVIDCPNYGNFGAVITHSNAINLSNYKTLNVSGVFNRIDSSSAEYVQLACWSPNLGTYWSNNIAASLSLASPINPTLTLDISSIKAMGFVGFAFFQCECTFTINKIWLD